MYDIRPNLIIGFHGCDADVRDKLINNPDTIVASKEPYDWLGHGMYFWENNYHRALQWAQDKYKRGKIKVPAVISLKEILPMTAPIYSQKAMSRFVYAIQIASRDSSFHGANQPFPSHPHRIIHHNLSP